MDKLTKRKAQKWANALRSGKYQQTTCVLQDRNGHCCLGVACELFISKRKQIRNGSSFLDGVLPTTMHQPNAPRWLNMVNDDLHNKTDHLKCLSALNDEGYTFNEIADIIELVYVHGALD